VAGDGVPNDQAAVGIGPRGQRFQVVRVSPSCMIADVACTGHDATVMDHPKRSPA
jgi:hypothetical protein